jgi:hypothetical protein
MYAYLGCRNKTLDGFFFFNNQTLLSESLKKKEVELAAERERWREATELQCRFDESFQGSKFSSSTYFFLRASCIYSRIAVKTGVERSAKITEKVCLFMHFSRHSFDLTPPSLPQCQLLVVGFESCISCSCRHGPVGERKRENPCFPEGLHLRRRTFTPCDCFARCKSGKYQFVTFCV